IKEDQILSMMTYVCCGISSLTLILTVICFLSIRSLHGRRSIITGNLCFSLLITNLLVIFGLDQTHNKILCAVIAGLLHFWILSAFCWMLVEGYHLYRMVILVFQRGSTLSIKLYYIFAYGTSAIVVSISAAVRSNDYARKDYCWLSSNNGLMWSFAGPACAIISVNIIVFILTLRSASSVRIKREQSTLKKIKSWVRGSMSVMCLLGLTWCVGLFYIDKKLHFFSYIFTILNGLQGVFIFFFHVLLNDKVNSWCSCKGSKQDRRKYLNQTSSNRLHSKTSTRTSMNSLGGTTSNLPISTSRSTETQANMISSKENGRVLPQSRTGFSNSKKTHINYRKNKATHTMSETMPSKASSSYVNKIRSRSLPEDT
ncbi:latrophilin-like protein LAT-2, partial [Stegodyphus dumicola]|uniref:latrophilin-like protein LAT-2 n=1 Tax=Stegodyphus dumicola TaxID=202533 RepID=UPI0015B0C5C0